MGNKSHKKEPALNLDEIRRNNQVKQQKMVLRSIDKLVDRAEQEGDKEINLTAHKAYVDRIKEDVESSTDQQLQAMHQQVEGRVERAMTAQSSNEPVQEKPPEESPEIDSPPSPDRFSPS